MRTISPCNDTIALVIPTHNRPALLGEAVASVQAQSTHPRQVVIVDDGSRPPVDRASLAASLAGVECKVVSHPRPAGGWAAKNAGVLAADASLVTFLDDDDLLRPDFFEKLMAAVSAHPDLDVLFVGVQAFGRHAAPLNRLQQLAMQELLQNARWRQGQCDVKLFDDGLVQHLLRSVPMAFQRPVVRREAFRRIGGFRGYRTWWEGEWAIRAAAQLRVGLLDIELHEWRVSDQGNFTRRDSKRTMLEVETEIKERLRTEFVQSRFRRLTMDAAAAAHWDYAQYLLTDEIEVGAALRAWARGMKHRPSIHGMRVLAASVARAAGRRLRPATRSR